MQVESPNFSRRQIAQLLSETNHEGSTTRRVEAISRHFLGYPYRAKPLIGAADQAEVFTASLDGFDCVTYIETTLALARATNVEEFADWLRTIRYEHGCIQWERRNHYMTSWISSNVDTGIVKLIAAPGLPLVSRDRVLNVVPGLATYRTRVTCTPKPAVSRLEPHLESGDLIFFVSTRKNLDVFHCGIIVCSKEGIRLRHASRSQGQVAEQELAAFLKANRMSGVILTRPQEVLVSGGPH